MLSKNSHGKQLKWGLQLQVKDETNDGVFLHQAKV